MPRSDHLPAFFATFRAKIDDPVGAFDDFEIVLDHHDRIARFDQALKQPDEKRDVVEMQTGGRFIEDEKIAAFSYRVAAVSAKMPNELKPLRFAAGKRVERLTEPQIAEPNFFQQRERSGQRVASPSDVKN